MNYKIFYSFIICLFLFILSIIFNITIINFQTKNRYCNGNNAIYKYKIFNIIYKTEYKENDIYCKY